MVSVLMGTAGLAALVIFNFVECVRLAVNGTLLAFPHALDQKYLVLLAWGFLVPVVWGFSARWLPTFLAISSRGALFRTALVLDLIGVLFGVVGWTVAATILLRFKLRSQSGSHCACAASSRSAKIQGIHPSFPSSFGLPMHGLLLLAQ